MRSKAVPLAPPRGLQSLSAAAPARGQSLLSKLEESITSLQTQGSPPMTFWTKFVGTPAVGS